MNMLKGRTRTLLAVVVLLVIAIVAVVLISSASGKSEINVSHSIVINRPVDEVFAFVAEPANYAKWSTGVNRVTSDGPMGVGTTLQQVREFLGRENVIDLEITEYVPNERISYSVTSGPTRGIQAEEYIEPTAGSDSTRLTFTARGPLSGVFGLTAPVANSIYQKQLETDLENLKALLES